MPPSPDIIISQLYEATAGLLPWPTALTSLSDAFGAMVVQYVSFDIATDQLILCEQPEGTVVDAVLDYLREYNRIDPHAAHLKQMPLGTVLDTETIFPARRMESHPFYRDFWAPYGVRGMLTGKIDEGDQHYSCIGIVRHKNSPGYTADDLALAARFVHHLTIAFKVARHFRKLQITSRVGLHVMEHADRPMILLGADQRILFSNAAGRDYLAGDAMLSNRNGRLEARGTRGAQTLRAALTALDSAHPIDGGGRTGLRKALRLEVPGIPTALCTLWRLDPEHRTSAFGDDAIVLLSIAHPHLGQPPDEHSIAAMLDLTPAESRLASQLVVGHELATIAALHGVSINTIRTQMRSIFQKTNTRRQAELIRIISRACL